MSTSLAVAKKVDEGGSLKPVEEYVPFVEKVARRMARRLPSHISLEDLISAGVVGLMEAMNRYDPNNGTDFEKFAEFRVKGAILDELRRRDLMARDARMESKNIENAIAGLASELGREPEEDEIASTLGLSVDDLRTKLEKLTPVKVVSFGDIYPVNMPSDDESPFDKLAKKELKAGLAQAIRKLSVRHQQVLQLYYREDLTLKEIGRVLEVTESRVCQIMSEATLRLRTLMKVKPPAGEKSRRRGRRGPSAR